MVSSPPQAVPERCFETHVKSLVNNGNKDEYMEGWSRTWLRRDWHFDGKKRKGGSNAYEEGGRRRRLILQTLRGGGCGRKTHQHLAG